MTTKNVTLSEWEYDQLREDQYLLNCLLEAGVNDWDGYEDVLEYFNTNKE